MVALPILMSQCAVLLSLLIFSHCAGVAAEAGEVAKNEKHLAAAHVDKVGADFIPIYA